MIEDHGTIRKWGAGGLCFPINKTVRQILDLEEGTPVKYKITSKGFYVERCVQNKDALFPMSLDTLLEGITPDNAHADLTVNLLNNEVPNYE